MGGGLLLSMPMYVSNLDMGSGLADAGMVGATGLLCAGCAAGLLDERGREKGRWCKTRR